MIDFNNLSAGLDNLDPVLLKAQTARVHEAVFDEGYVSGRLGRGRSAPPYRDPEMVTQWLAGFDAGTARRVDQRIPEGTTCA